MRIPMRLKGYLLTLTKVNEKKRKITKRSDKVQCYCARTNEDQSNWIFEVTTGCSCTFLSWLEGLCLTSGFKINAYQKEQLI